MSEFADVENIQDEIELLKQFVEEGRGDGDGEPDVAPVVVPE